MDISTASKVVQDKNKMTVAELDAYCEKLRTLPCPSCTGTAHKLNATRTSEVMSFIFFTQYKRQIKIACPTCLDKANNKALMTSLLLGWWGLPWGIIRTIQALGQNSKKQNHNEQPNDYLRSFAYHNIGKIVQHQHSPRMLQQLITPQ